MKEITIDGWMVMDEIEIAPDIHVKKPHRQTLGISSIDKTIGVWESPGIKFSLDRQLFPQIHWETEPQKVTVSIKLHNN